MLDILISDDFVTGKYSLFMKYIIYYIYITFVRSETKIM